jgi:hypothetical protein
MDGSWNGWEGPDIPGSMRFWRSDVCAMPNAEWRGERLARGHHRIIKWRWPRRVLQVGFCKPVQGHFGRNCPDQFAIIKIALYAFLIWLAGRYDHYF